MKNNQQNILLVIEYLGTNYCGFQKQNNGVSIQQKIEDAIFSATKNRATVYPSGRTDAGVHALAQTVNFFSSTTIPMEKLPIVLNFYLPNDIRVLKAKKVSQSFHSRKSAKKKTYIYKIFLGKTLSVFDENRVLSFSLPLDFDLLNQSARLLIGKHDFSAFVSTGSTSSTTVREIYDAKFVKNGQYLTFSITGNGFLYNMVRIIVGTLLEIGSGKRPLSSLGKALNSGNRRDSGKTAPPYGLYLKHVYY